MVTQRFQYTTLVIIALVALRLGIGWQFYKEGANKFEDPKPYSAMVLSSAKGPLAPNFQAMVWDKDGYARLDLGQTLGMWEEAQHRAARHFGFNEEQKKEAEGVYKRYNSEARQFFADYGSDIREYFAEMDRIRRDHQDAAMSDVASLNGQVAQREAEQTGKLRGWLAKVDDMWSRYERDLNVVAADEQLQSHGAYALDKPGRRFMDSVWVDSAVRWFDLVIGLLLIVGLFTRFTAIAAALFLGSIVLTQPPWVAGAAPTYYQVNLMLALLVLAAVGAGRFAGLDFLLGRLRYWCCPPKQETKR